MTLKDQRRRLLSMLRTLVEGSHKPHGDFGGFCDWCGGDWATHDCRIAKAARLIEECEDEGDD